MFSQDVYTLAIASEGKLAKKGLFDFLDNIPILSKHKTNILIGAGILVAIGALKMAGSMGLLGNKAKEPSVVQQTQQISKPVSSHAESAAANKNEVQSKQPATKAPENKKAEKISLEEQKKAIAKIVNGNTESKKSALTMPVVKRTEKAESKKISAIAEAQKEIDKARQATPLPKIEEKSTSKAGSKEQAYILNRKKALVSKLLDSEVELPLLSGKKAISIKNATYTEGENIPSLPGFKLGKIWYSIKPGKLLSLTVHANILDKDTGKKVREVSARAESSYDIVFYEDGIELIEKKTKRSTDIILPGQTIASLVKFDNNIIKGNKSEYEFTLIPNKKKIVEVVDISKVQ